jgi:hypothetical protein
MEKEQIVSSHANDLAPVIVNIKKRAKATRRFAKILILIIVAVVGLVLIFFYTTSQYSPYGRFETKKAIRFLGFEFLSEQEVEAEKTSIKSPDAASKEMQELLAEKEALERAANERAFILNTIGASILRIGSVFLAVYLIQILINLTRYHFRIADHLDSLCDSMAIPHKNLDELYTLVNIIMPKHIDFGAMPKGMDDKVADILKATVSKLPGK